MANGADDRNQLAPPEPPDPAGTRPAFDLAGMLAQVIWIQGKLAQERAAKKLKAGK